MARFQSPDIYYVPLTHKINGQASDLPANHVDVGVPGGHITMQLTEFVAGLDDYATYLDDGSRTHILLTAENGTDPVAEFAPLPADHDEFQEIYNARSLTALAHHIFKGRSFTLRHDGRDIGMIHPLVELVPV